MAGWLWGAGTPAPAVPQALASPFPGGDLLRGWGCCRASSTLSPPCPWDGGAQPYQPPARAGAAGPPAQIWRSLAGVPGRAPYLHVRVHACDVSLLYDNKSLVTTCPGSRLASPVPVPLLPRPWAWGNAGGFALLAAGVGCSGAAGPCSGRVFPQTSGIVVPIHGAPAELGASPPSPCPHGLLVPSPGLL